MCMEDGSRRWNKEFTHHLQTEREKSQGEEQVTESTNRLLGEDEVLTASFKISNPVVDQRSVFQRMDVVVGPQINPARRFHCK